MRAKTKYLSSPPRVGFHATRATAIANIRLLARANLHRSLFDSMDPELEKLIEAGKLTSKAAEKLDALKPGTFCLHKSWGFGRIA